MSMSTSTIASASLPTVQQLLSAVQSNTTPDAAIKNLFVSTLDKIPSEDARIKDALRVYQDVQVGSPSHAVFYKLSDVEQAVKKMSAAFEKVLSEAIKRPITYLKLENLIENYEYNGNDRQQLVAKEISPVLSANMNDPSHKIYASQTIPQKEIERLFSDALKQRLVNGELNSFFKFPDRAVAAKKGALYDPDTNETHNWGVNAVWTAALAVQRAPISILSPLLQKNGVHPSNSPFTPGSSAFALEIAIAIKMGGLRSRVQFRGSSQTLTAERPQSERHASNKVGTTANL